MAQLQAKGKSKEKATEGKSKIINRKFFWPSVILLAASLLLYGNTLFNDYALDDGLMFTNNKLVTKGFSGIGGILTHDSFYGALGTQYSLNGGRWRPLSLISFAIEYQLFGLAPWISHLINVMLYALTAILLMKFLSLFMQRQKMENGKSNVQFSFTGFGIPFFAALLFVIHPIHTEVVANIKSRDEILSLLFLILTLYYCIKWYSKKDEQEKKQSAVFLFKSLFCYALALLSKENGLTFIFIIPVTLYLAPLLPPKGGNTIANPPFGGWRGFLLATFPFIFIAALYIIIRVSLIGFSTVPVNELLDNPYMQATTEQKFATIFFALLFYLRLLVFPHPLLFDYSFNQIPYHHFNDITVIAALLIHISLFAYAIRFLVSPNGLVARRYAESAEKKVVNSAASAPLREFNLKPQTSNLLAWCILFYLASIFIVSNIALSVGTTLAERFLYQPSIAFCLAAVILVNIALDKIAKENRQLKIRLAVALSIIVFIPAAAQTISRNRDWKNDSSLFIHDQKLSPNNARAATYAGIRYTTDGDSIKDEAKKQEYRRQALSLFEHAYEIYPNSASNYLNWGVVYSRMDSLDKAEWAWNEGRKIKPNSTLLQQYDKFLSETYYRRGLEKGLKTDDKKDLKNSIVFLNKAVKYDSTNPEYWYNLGGAYFTNSQLDSAKFCWEKTLSLNPNHPDATRGLQALKGIGH